MQLETAAPPDAERKLTADDRSMGPGRMCFCAAGLLFCQGIEGGCICGDQSNGFTLAAIVVTLVLSPLAGNWAQGGDGAGDGSGGGQNNPLVIESSAPANGAAGVASLEYIKTVFSKNVVYMTVRDKKLQCLSLWSGSQRIPA